MRRIGGSFRVARLGAVVAALVVVALVAACQVGASTYARGLSGGTLLGNPLVVPGADALIGGQQQAVVASKRANPLAAAARERSRLAYGHLTTAGVRRLLADSFPVVMRHQAGSLELPAGASVAGYATTHAARLKLAGHMLGIAESTSPLAKRGAHGRLSALDLTLRPSGSGYAPVSSDATVQIPSRLAAGVSAPAGVSLTPVGSDGHALAGSGSVAGSTVLYPNTQPATDTVVKPTATGFEIDAMLRSVDSPEFLYYRIGMPAGAKLVQNRLTGEIDVIENGSRIATVLPPGSVDAAGASVPTTMTLSGDIVVVDVAHREGSYLYPINVDPEINDKQLASVPGKNITRWKFKTSNGARFSGTATYEGSEKGRLEATGIAEYVGGEFAYWVYETKGNSKIYELKTKTSAKNKSAKIESYLSFSTGITNENQMVLSTEFTEPEYAEKISTICAWNASKVEECLPGAGKEANAVRFEQAATASPGSNYKFSDTMSEGVVSISEPAGEHSTTSFNTTSPEVNVEVEEEEKKVIQKRKNALYGAGLWMSKFNNTGIQLISKDPGIGVAKTWMEYQKPGGGWEKVSGEEHNYLENSCEGEVQCYTEHTEGWTVEPKVPDGIDKIRYRAEEAIAGTVSPSGESSSAATVKIDTKAPYEIELHGLPNGNELSERVYTLSATAVDGEGTTVGSSGVEKLALAIVTPTGELHEIPEVGTQTGCSVAAGECTAKAEWMLNGAEIGAGHHAIVVTAIDHAGNYAEPLEETLLVRHSTPVALGPGSVDLQSGDFALSATDVSLGSGLTVSRNHSSRATLSGVEGPLGSEWNISLGKTESLSEMVDGSVLLTASNGKQTIFALNKGKFESPFGDSNLTLELEENKTTKEKLAYYLKNPAAGTSDKFTLPSGSKVWLPAKQEGTVATDTLIYTYKSVTHQDEFPTGTSEATPASIATGPDGNIWYSDEHNNKVGKMSSTGAVLAEYATEGTGGIVPGSIAGGADGNLWFLEGSATVGFKNKVVKITTAGKQTAYSIPSGSSQYIVAGPDGNMWFSEPFAKKVGKVTPSGAITEYTIPGGGTPYAMTAGPDGNVWFTTSTPATVSKITPAGVVKEYAAAGFTHMAEGATITTGPDKFIWFAGDAGGTKGMVGKMTPEGKLEGTYTLPTNNRADTLMSGPDGTIWFSHGTPGPNFLGKITTGGTITEFELERTFNMTIGPDGNGWYTDNSNKTIDRTTPSMKVSRPTEVLAPVPSGVSCSPTMKAGCRALLFFYEGLPASSRLSYISLEAYEPVAKAMRQTRVASYGYNAHGDLIEEWDPRFGTGLKTRYGYDSEGHLTALTPPGQETWAFTYGTQLGDQGQGRLLKVTRPAASETVWTGGAVPKNTELPAITGAAYPGMRMTVSDGVWTGSPLVYGYQWEDCGLTNELCTPIGGANSASYTLTSSDIGHKLAVLVTATNGGGTTTVRTALTVEVQSRITEDVVYPTTGVRGITTGSDGNLWEIGSTQIRKRSATPNAGGSFYSLPAGSEGWGITSGPDGNLWFTERATSKIGKITTTGTITEYALPAGSAPQGITSGPDGNLWFVEYNKKIVGKITTAGVITTYTLPTGGSKPISITAGPDGNLWLVTEVGFVMKVTTGGTITAYKFPEERYPYWITSGPDGNLWVAQNYSDKIAKVTTSGSITEYSLPAGSQPNNIASGPDGNLWFTEWGTNRIGKITTAGSIYEYSAKAESQPWGITKGPDGNMWFSEYHSGFAGRLTIGGSEGSVRTPARAWVMEYATPLTEGSGLQNMTASSVAKWGQTDVPVEATAIIPPDADQGWPASSYQRATVYYLDAKGRSVNVAKPSTAPYGSVTTTEYNGYNDAVRALTPDNRQVALEAGANSVDEAKSLSTYYSYRSKCSKESENNHETESTEPGSRLCDIEGPQHEITYISESKQKEALGRLHTKYFYDEEAPSGETYNLRTKTATLDELSNEAKEEIEGRVVKTSYSGQTNLGWKLRAPTSVTVDPEGKKLTTTTLYNAGTGQVTETRAPAGSGGGSAHDTKLIYYSAEPNTEGYAACGSHPEWSGLLCERLPAKQPATGPSLPIVTMTYNMWNEPLVTTETFGSTVRTKTNIYAYAEGSELSSSETTSTANTALPYAFFEYNSKTGALETQRITVGGEFKTLKKKYNALAQLTEYTDEDGNITKYRYGGVENDFLLEEIADGSNSGTGKQSYTYNSTTKLREEMVDSAAGIFTASYDAEGNLKSEVYPNAMCANYGRDATGEQTHIEYIKTTNCSEGSPTVWYSETLNPSVRGEALARSSTLANETYSYDTVGRLIEAQETPAGEGCSTRLYGYDEESNRTSQTTRAPGGGGSCATEGGTVLNHSYSEGNLLSDTGVGYDSFGDVTKLPAADAEGHELVSTFYVDGAVASQTQNGVTNNYYLDPEGRVRETVSGATTVTSHYDGPGEAVAWTSESGGKSTRNIPGIDGALTAVQTNGGTPVLQLHDLQGNVIATAALSPTETALLSTYNSTEFGVPNAEKTPPKFAWLGATDVASAFSTGVITYGATSWVPQTGRALQGEPVEPPGAPGGSGAGSPYRWVEDPHVFQAAAASAAEAPGREADRERAAAEAAEEATLLAVDPTESMNLSKAGKRGTEYLELESVAEVLAYFGLPEEKALSEIAGKLAGEIFSEMEDAFKWLNDAGEKLRKCSENHRGLHICKFTYDVNELKVPILGTLRWPRFSVEPIVLECEDYGPSPTGAGRFQPCFYEVHIGEKEL